jgi:hypothetical protein
MTSPTAAPQNLVNGQDIGVAARATRSVLDRFLATAGIDFDLWIALRVIDQAGRALPRAELVQTLVTNLGLDPATARLLIERVVALGWYAPSGADLIGLSQAGVERYASLLAGVGDITAELYGGIDVADLMAAKRVLVEVARRAAARAAI